jgi:hypothetical protein
MSVSRWVGVESVSGELQAEILRGLLEAQGIPVMLSQEGAGRAIGLNVGRLGEVEILVPEDWYQQALQVLADYHAGRFENEAEFPSNEVEDFQPPEE